MVLNYIEREWPVGLASLCDAPAVERDLDDFPDGHPTRAFAGYWARLSAAAPGDAAPKRSAIDPCDIPGLLKWLMIFDREDILNGTVRYRLRLQGAAAAQLTKGDQTGRYLDQFTPENCYQSRFHILESTVRIKSPHSAEIIVQPETADSDFAVSINAAFFPFAREDGEAGHVIVVAAPHDECMRRAL